MYANNTTLNSGQFSRRRSWFVEKTTAALVNYANEHRREHILTIEDPIEFRYESLGCMVSQREVGLHTTSFQAALRVALREDADIVVVGEMRDRETVH